MPEVIPTTASVTERVAGILTAAGEPLRYSDLLRRISTAQRRVLPHALLSDRFSVTNPAAGGRLVALRTTPITTQGVTMSTPSTPDARTAPGATPGVAPNGGAPTVTSEVIERHRTAREARPKPPRT